jgi:serine/threonine-protein kinase 24/25/MST4
MLLANFHRPQIQFLSDCDHPNVVRYLGSFRLPDALWIVMEHCGGGSVGDLLQVGELSSGCW